MNKIYKSYFEPIKFYGVPNKQDCEAIQACINTLDAFARLSHQSCYVIDYYKQNFLYVSPHRLILNNLKVEDIKNIGYEHYYNIVPYEDLRFLEFINKKGFEFFYKTLPTDDRLQYSISYDFHIYFDKKKQILINHQLTPILLNEQKQIWLALCLISISPQKHKGEIVIRKIGESFKYVHNQTTHQWMKEEEVTLSDTEINILRYSEQGYSNEEIAQSMFYNVNSIKFHKKQIYALLKVNNIHEAIAYAYKNKLM